MTTKDPLQELTDALTSLRSDIYTLEEAIAESVSEIKKAGPDSQKAIENSLSTVVSGIQIRTTRAAETAARNAIRKSHQENRDAARIFSQAAGEARREAWRHFGGFWVWLVSMLATGVALGLFIAFGTETAKTFFSVPEMASYACEWRTWGGQIIDQDDGSSFCALWIELRPHSGN